MKSDIEIAQSAKPVDIYSVAGKPEYQKNILNLMVKARQRLTFQL